MADCRIHRFARREEKVRAPLHQGQRQLVEEALRDQEHEEQ